MTAGLAAVAGLPNVGVGLPKVGLAPLPNDGSVLLPKVGAVLPLLPNMGAVLPDALVPKLPNRGFPVTAAVAAVGAAPPKVLQRISQLQ